MGLFDQLMDDMKTAMRAKDKKKILVVRTMISDAKKVAIDTKVEKTDDLVEAVLVKALKQRKDSLATYEQSDREDLAEQERYEIEIISTYLPEPLTEEEVRQEAKKIYADCDVEGNRAMGMVMKGLKEKFGSRFEGKMGQGIVKEIIAG